MGNGRVALSVAALLLVVVAAIDGGLVAGGRTAGVDRAVLLALAGGPVALWRAISLCGNPPVRGAIALIGLIALLAQRRGRAAAALALAFAGGLLLSGVLKDGIARPRPALLPHLDRVTSWSFPSGHALNGAVVYLMLALLLPPPRWRTAAVGAALALVAAIGTARLALAVHWPSDVIAGWAIGGAWVCLCAAVFADPARRRGVAPRHPGETTMTIRPDRRAR